MKHAKTTAISMAKKILPDESAEKWFAEPKGVLLILLIGTLSIIAILSMNAWYQSRNATKEDVQKSVASLSESCKPILRTMFHNKLVETGRPLTRKEVKTITNSIKDCDVINEQLLGLQNE